MSWRTTTASTRRSSRAGRPSSTCAGAVHDLSGPKSLGEMCELLGELDLFPGAPPVRDPSRHYRRCGYESPALDLALRQAGKQLGEVIGRELQALNFVCSTRLTVFGEEPRRSSTDAI